MICHITMFKKKTLKLRAKIILLTFFFFSFLFPRFLQNTNFLQDVEGLQSLAEEKAARSRIVSPIKSLNISRSMSKTASETSTGQSPHSRTASPLRSFLKTPHITSNKSSDSSLSRIRLNSAQTWLSDACPVDALVAKTAFQGGNCLYRLRISAIVSKISRLWSLETFEASFPLRCRCFSSNWKTLLSSEK